MTQHWYKFSRNTCDHNSSTRSEHSFACPDDARWDEVVLQFATFLDTCGYVGVYNALDLMLADHWDKKWDILEDDDEE